MIFLRERFPPKRLINGSILIILKQEDAKFLLLD